MPWSSQCRPVKNYAAPAHKTYFGLPNCAACWANLIVCPHTCTALFPPPSRLPFIIVPKTIGDTAQSSPLYPILEWRHFDPANKCYKGTEIMWLQDLHFVRKCVENTAVGKNKLYFPVAVRLKQNSPACSKLVPECHIIYVVNKFEHYPVTYVAKRCSESFPCGLQRWVIGSPQNHSCNEAAYRVTRVSPIWVCTTACI